MAIGERPAIRLGKPNGSPKGWLIMEKRLNSEPKVVSHSRIVSKFLSEAGSCANTIRIRLKDLSIIGLMERCGPSHKNRSKARGRRINSSRALTASNPEAIEAMTPSGGSGILREVAFIMDEFYH